FIPYKRFQNIKRIGEGGYGIVESAEWLDGRIICWNNDIKDWDRFNKKTVVIKTLHKSENLNQEFFQEIDAHFKLAEEAYVTKCYGITQNPETNNHGIVISYASSGCLRKYLTDHKFIDWSTKLYIVIHITGGLERIHKAGLVHHDLHPGNILVNFNNNEWTQTKIPEYLTWVDTNHTQIADLGLCRSANKKEEDESHGVIYYLAPEVLQGKPYTQAADVYAFGILFNVIASGKPPFSGDRHNPEAFIAKVVEEHYRPDIPAHVPNFIGEIINNCWKHDPQERPKADYLNNTLYKYWLDFYEKKDNEITRKCKESDEEAKAFASSNISNHFDARYYSSKYKKYND
ncbi:12440_t:CDS:2, partial [Racocetra fulgida]